jgi:hypothetical protein
MFTPVIGLPEFPVVTITTSLCYVYLIGPGIGLYNVFPARLMQKDFHRFIHRSHRPFCRTVQFVDGGHDLVQPTGTLDRNLLITRSGIPREPSDITGPFTGDVLNIRGLITDFDDVLSPIVIEDPRDRKFITFNDHCSGLTTLEGEVKRHPTRRKTSTDILLETRPGHISEGESFDNPHVWSGSVDAEFTFRRFRAQ